MDNQHFVDEIDSIRDTDPRYELDAYVFVCEALQYTSRMLDKPRSGPDRHVSPIELLEGIRKYALQEFGPMARTVFGTWGITRTGDFGNVVFNMIDREIFGKTGTDKPEDFADGYAFEDAFTKPYLPTGRPGPQRSTRPRGRPRLP